MNLFLAMLLKPFVALAILIPTFFLAHVVWRYLPDSRFKRRLFKPLPGHKARNTWS